MNYKCHSNVNNSESDICSCLNGNCINVCVCIWTTTTTKSNGNIIVNSCGSHHFEFSIFKTHFKDEAYASRVCTDCVERLEIC